MKFRIHLLGYILVLITTSSCDSINSISYYEFKTVKSNHIWMLKKNAKKKERQSFVYLHFEDNSNEVLQMEQMQFSDSSVSGLIVEPIYPQVVQFYYKVLKREATVSEKKTSKIPIYHYDRDKKLDQIHLWIADSIRPAVNKNYRMGINKIRTIEKVERFDKRKLWLFWLTIGFLPLAAIVAIIVLVTNLKLNVSIGG